MHGIENLYHLAATTGGDWATHYQGTVVGTRNVIQAAAEAGVRKVVYVSSLGVLHSSRFPNGAPIDESFPLDSQPELRGEYSRAKLEAEQLVMKSMNHTALSVRVLRPGLVYGPGDGRFLSDAGFRISSGVVLVLGLGGRRLGLTYVENLVDALLLAAENPTCSGTVYHIVDPDQPTVRQYIRTYEKAADKPLTVVYLPTSLWTTAFGLLDGFLPILGRTSPHWRYRIRSIAHGPRYDTTAAQEGLGWSARVSFEDGMARTYAREESGS
jgi:nucleoside-diphosphate-sugar epimerase